MNINKITVIGSVIIILLALIIPTTYKIIKDYHKDLLEVVEEEIINSAKDCYYEEKCPNEKITLKELYELKLLDKMSNPITKEYYNENSYVEIKDDKFLFVVVE